MLEYVSEASPPHAVYRFANRRRAVEIISELARRRNLDNEAVREMLEFLGPANGAAEELLNGPFEAKAHLNDKWHASRFSDGNWPVFYGALDLETSEAEIVYHLEAGQMQAALSAGGPVYFSQFHCTFDGRALDLRPKLTEWPWLVDSNTKNARCQALGREAHEKDIDGFLAPSVRNSGGTNVPVFAREMLSQVMIDGNASFSPDPTTGKVQIRYI